MNLMEPIERLLRLLAFSVPLATAGAQGADNCASATPIAGFGSFVYSTAGATTTLPITCWIFDDVWFEWVAPITSQVSISTCDVPAADSNLAVYASGGCPTIGALLGCNDDACGLQSQLSVAVVAGQTYAIQIGSSLAGPSEMTDHGVIMIVPEPHAGAAVCPGTSSGCPCGNVGSGPRGCANSVEPEGARLHGSGSASLSAADLVLTAMSLPFGTALFFQGDVVPGAGTGVAFGDGLRCASGNVVRLDIVASPSGAAQCPAPGAASIAARSGAPPGSVRVYQAWYRDAASFCTSATFNLTNGLAIQWTP